MAKRVKVVTAAEAVAQIKDNDTIWLGGSGGGQAVAQKLIDALEQRFLETQSPTQLRLLSTCGIGDWGDVGASQLAKKGLLRGYVAGGISNSPRVGEMALAGEIEVYIWSMGIMSQMTREMARGNPGLITRTGLHTFIDPRLEGGRQGPKRGPDLVEVVNLAGEELLFFHATPIDVAFIRATTSDTKGNLTMEHDPIYAENLSVAQATHRNGGIVIAQVERMTEYGTLRGKDVKVPGILVDYVVVEPDAWQSYVLEYDPAYAGEVRVPQGEMPVLPLDIRKVVARRAAMELRPNAVVNLGFGMANGIALVAAEEGIYQDVTLTVEQGLVGGVPALGNDAGSARNYEAMLDTPYQFDFYDGGGLDMAFLSFAELDREGNVNVSRFRHGVTGPGGFTNISQYAKKVFFLGSLTAGKQEHSITGGGIQVVTEGKFRKFVEKVQEITWSGPYAMRRGQPARVITERAVFDLTPDGLVLIEVAEGIDIKREVLDQVPFPVIVPGEVAKMDPRIFAPEPMGIKDDPFWKEEN